MIVKCWWCGEKDTDRKDMNFDLVGEKSKKYYHKECYPKFLEHKKFKKEESKKLDDLYNCIKDIYQVKGSLPPSAVALLQDMRNGKEVLRGRKMGKRYKEGYSYEIIQKTFEECEKDIHYSIATKTHIKGFMGIFKYTLTIVLDNIYNVAKDEEDRKYSEELLKHRELNTNDSESIYQPSYKKSKNIGQDVNDFLND